ncbi:MAG: hypothetical protein WA610_05450, partial [Thermodesulfovibrionales bacterium]
MNVTKRFFLLYLMFCFAAVAAGCSREPQKSAPVQAPVRSDGAAKSTLLATIAEQEKPQSAGSGHNASSSQTSFYVDFNKTGTGVVYIAEQDGKLHVVHNGAAGKLYQSVNNLRISPDGKRVAYVVQVNDKSSLVVDGREGPLYDDIGPPVFSPDSRHIAYKVQSGEQLHIVVDGKISDGYRRFNGPPAFSSDSTMIAYAEGAEENRGTRLVVSGLDLKSGKIMESCGDQMVTSSDSNRIAAVCVIGGKARAIEFSFSQLQKITEGPLYEGIGNLTFSRDGTGFSYAAEKGGAVYLIMNGREEKLPKAALVSDPVIRPDKKGAGVIMGDPEKVFLHQAFYNDGTKEKNYTMIEDLAYNGDGSAHAYAALKDKKWRIVVNGKEGPAFDRVVGPLFTPDGKLSVYRARKDGKRFVVVADADGKTIRQHPSYEQVFQPVFTSDGKSVA